MTVYGNRCGDYHIPTATTTTTGMNISRKTTNPGWGQFRRAKGAKSSRRNHLSACLVERWRDAGFCRSQPKFQPICQTPQNFSRLS